MKRLLTTMMAAMLAAVAMAGNGVNPQFLKWQKMKAAGMLPQQKKALRAQMQAQKGISLQAAKGGFVGDIENQVVGLAPDVAQLGYLADLVGKKGWDPVDGYPAKFDLREEAAVSAVRNQGKFEACWAFATLASLESSLLVQKPDDATYTAADLDFSERHMIDRSGFDLTPKQGGSMMMSMAYLLGWKGPVLETESPYPAANVEDWVASDVVANPRLHVQQVRWIPGKTKYLENDQIKENVMTKGGVYVTFYMDKNTYYNADKAAYFCPRSFAVNHGVTIVGWDDNYPKENFKETGLLGWVRPLGDGAYLAKNSWGVDWGENGYFWISYYDANFAVSPMAVFCGNERKDNYKTLYQYDELGYTGESHAGGSPLMKAWMANVYTAEAADQIAAVGFYALAPDTEYMIRVYTDIPEGGSPADGTLRDSNTQTGKLAYPGFVTVPLDKVVEVAAGGRFAVCVHLYSKTGALSGIKPLALESVVGGYSTRATAEAGQSWFSPNGSRWTDLANSQRGANFCLKAYGIGADGDDPKETRKAVGLDVDGAAVLAAGATGDYAVTMLYDDNSTWADGLEIDFEVVSGNDALSGISKKGNVVSLTVRSDLAADTKVVLRFSAYDWIGDVDVTKEIAFTATQAVPTVPTEFIATAGTVDSGVRLSWTKVANASTYAVYRSTTEDAAKATFLATAEGDRYTDLTAEPGINYTYFLKAQNSSGSSAFTSGQTGWRKLSAPENVTASDGDYDDVQLTWSAATGASFYKVVRDEDMDEFGNPTENAVEVSEWIEALAFRDTPPVKDKVYYYWVKSALSWTGYRASDWSIFDAGSRWAPVTLSAVRIDGAANVPSGAKATYTLSATLSNGAHVEHVTNATWTCSLGGEPFVGETYEFDTSLYEETWAVSSNVLVSVRASWTFKNEDGESVKQDEKFVVVAPVAPKQPKAVKVIESTTGGVRLAWDPVDGATYYNLYFGSDLEHAQLLLSTSELEYFDAKIPAGAAYHYWLEAANAAGASPKSEASANALRQFTPPNFVSASNGTSTEDVTVTWRNVNGANFYRVSRSDTPGGDRHDLSGWIAERSFKDTTATPGVTYYYYVEAAYDAEGGSASAVSAPTIGKLSPAQSLVFIEIAGPATIQYDSQGAFACTATFANGVQERVKPSWSFKSAHPLVTVDAEGIVTAGHVTGEDLHLELEASYTVKGITKTDSFAVTIIAFKEEKINPTVFVSNVVVRARWPWNGIVDISYDLYSVPGTTRAVVTVSGTDHDLGRTLQAVTIWGDGVDHPTAGGQPNVDCRVSWNLGADYTNFHASAFSVALDAAPFEVSAPAGLRASDNTSTNGVELAWEESFGAVSYEIYRSLDNDFGNAEKLADVTDATAYTDGSAEYGETYYYWIKTIAGEFESDVSDPAGPVAGKRLKPPSIKPSVNLQDGLVAFYVQGEEGWQNLIENSPPTVDESFTYACWVATDKEGVLAAEQLRGLCVNGNNVLEPGTNGVSMGLSVLAGGVNVLEGDGQMIPAVVRCPTDMTGDVHLVVVTVDEDGAPILYVDGVYAKTGLSTGKDNKYIRVFEPEASFDGTVEKTCYYDRALTAEEIAALFEAGTPLSGNKPVSTAPVVNVTYADGQATVTISCHEEGADADVQPTVYYSIIRKDGGDTVDSREYTVPFTVEGDATVIAWSVKTDYFNSPRVKVEVKADWKQTAHAVLAPLDVTGQIDFDTFGDCDWVFDPNETSDPVVGSMRSGKIGSNGASAMRARVKGAGLFAFDWKVSSEAEFDFLVLTVDGETAHKISGEVGWHEMVLELEGDGEHVITWTYAKDASTDRGQDCGWVDYVTWAKAGSYVDAPLAVVTPIDGGASNRVEISSALPGAAIEYRMTVFGNEGEWTAYEGPFVFEGDGVVYMRAKKSGFVDSQVSSQIVRRPWVVRAGEALLMDEVSRESVALYGDYFEYGTDEEFWWDQDRTVVSDGTWASMKSPKLRDALAEEMPMGYGASMYAKVVGAGTLYFDRKVDSEAGWDVLTYYAGEEDEFDYFYGDAISGDRDWERVKLVFQVNGPHVIEWEYNKDDTGKAGRDTAWVDYVKWVPARYAPAVPEPRIGYVFGGFGDGSTNVAKYAAGEMLDAEDTNENFVPIWTPISYKVAYAAQLGEEGTANEQVFVYDEDQALLAAENFAFARGYAFKGWSKGDSGKVDFTDGETVRNLASEQDAVVTLKPVLEPISYTVRFYEGADKAADDIAATYDVAFVMPVLAERKGWRFDGWSRTPAGDVQFAPGAEAKNLTDEDKSSVILYARWTQIADPISEALDVDGLEFASEGDAVWGVQDKESKEGDTAPQSGKISGDQSSVLKTTITSTNRVRVSFWWKVSSEANWDKLTFAVNGVAKASISGLDGDWTEVVKILPPGTSVLTWTYSKDGTGDRGDDCGWIDRLTIEELPPLPPVEAIHVAITGNDATGDGTLENPYRTIQHGVDVAESGMSVFVHAGEYDENVTVEKAVKLIAVDGPLMTTVKGGTAMKAVIRIVEEAGGTQVTGFTLTAGRGQDCGSNKYGGAMEICARADVRDCIMQGNGCSSLTFAGGVHACGSSAYVVFENCLFYDNYAWACGGASLVEGQATTVFSHCTAAGNKSDNYIGQQGGFSVANSGTLIVTNSIAYGNQGQQIAAYGSYYGRESVLKVGNSCVQGGVAANGAGTFENLGGNITTNPDYYSISNVPYQSALRMTKDMGFSLAFIRRYNPDGTEVEPEEPIIEPDEPAVFKVIQYTISKRPYTVDDALAATNTPSIWMDDPCTGTYGYINFTDNPEYTLNFPNGVNSFPGNVKEGRKATYYACQCSGDVNIPEAGWWTFACGSDDGFRCVLTDEDGKSYSFEYYKDRSYATTVQAFNLTKPGRYHVYLIYFEYGGCSNLDLSCRKGKYSTFSKSSFKLVGTEASGVPVVGKRH